MFGITWTRRMSTWHDPVWGWIILPPGLRTRRIGPGALSRKDRAIFMGIIKRNPGHVLVWLMNGIRAVPREMLLEAKNMVDATDLEKAAIAAALRPMGEYVGSIGMTRPLADYSKDEVLTLVEVVITAYQEHMANA
ncbi:MAG: hypothetical protein HQL52_13685, partial [Magnetococcales bacterium]|nr:hypothetical protein [Magnetococcales bacterium]